MPWLVPLGSRTCLWQEQLHSTLPGPDGIFIFLYRACSTLGPICTFSTWAIFRLITSILFRPTMFQPGNNPAVYTYSRTFPHFLIDHINILAVVYSWPFRSWNLRVYLQSCFHILQKSSLEQRYSCHLNFCSARYYMRFSNRYSITSG